MSPFSKNHTPNVTKFLINNLFVNLKKNVNEKKAFNRPNFINEI